MRTLFAFIFGLTLTHQSFAGAGDIYGKWSFPEQTIDSGKYSVILQINQNEVTIFGKCERDGVIATAQLSVPARVTPTTVHILQSHTMAVSENGLDCQVTANNGTLSYVLLRNGIQLRMLPLGTLSDATRID